MHLKLIAKCADCHTAAASSKSVADDLRPSAQACVRCHQNEDKTAGRVDLRARKIAKFDHSLHAKLGNIASVLVAAIDQRKYLSDSTGLRAQLVAAKQNCEGCHRGLRVSDAQPKAEHLPHMSDCLVCHNRIDPPDTCVQCHTPEQAKRPANHTPDFHSSHSGRNLGLDIGTCAACHGRSFSCQGCH